MVDLAIDVLLSVCVLAVLCEAKSPVEDPVPQLMQAQVEEGYPSPSNYYVNMPQNYPGLYPLPFNYHHEFDNLPQPSYDQKMNKLQSYPKYYKKSKKPTPEPKYEYGFKNQYPWQKYETDVKSHIMPQALAHEYNVQSFTNEYNKEPVRQYRAPVIDYEPKARKHHPASNYDNAYGHHGPVRENVNIFITPPSKRRSKKARLPMTSSEESYGKYRIRRGWRGKCAPASYERVYRSPRTGGVEQPLMVDYDPSAERRLRLYRRELFGSSSSSSSSSSSEQVVSYASHKWLYPKRSPQHPEEFFASQKPSNASSPSSQSASSEDTLSFIRRVLATQRQTSPSGDVVNEDKPMQSAERSHSEYSILGEGLLSGYAGDTNSNGFFEGKPGTRQFVLNETYTEESNSDSASSMSS